MRIDGQGSNVIRRVVIGLTILALVGGFLLLLSRTPGVRWIGGFPLEVRLVPQNDHRIAKLSLGTMNGAMTILADMRRGILVPDCRFREVDWPNVPVIALEGKCTGEDSMLGRELSYSEEDILVLKLELVDGKTDYRYFEIPPGRGRRSMTVEVP